MALDFQKTLPSLSTLDLWYKVVAKEELYLSDIPELIRLKWPYFRDNWHFIKDKYEKSIPYYSEPEALRSQIQLMTDFVDMQRNTKNAFDSEFILVRFFAIFDNTSINSDSLNYEERQIIDNKKNEVLAYTRKDFLNIRSQLEKERDELTDRIGCSSSDYNTVFARSSQPFMTKAKNKDMNNILELQEAIKSVNFILANSFSLSTSTIDPFALAKANANNPEIDIQTYFSGFLAKLNYGEDLQSLASRYLGDPNKWIDIAITNGLKAPYIDEVGEKIYLIASGGGNKINIKKVDSNGNSNSDKLIIGQPILLQSSTLNFPEQRLINNIIEIPQSGEIIIELSGEEDLHRYNKIDNAYIRVFKLNTTNSSFFIMIPSKTKLDDNNKSDTPWFLKKSDGIEKKQKVDICINDNGDIDFNSSSDLNLSYGLNNSVQAVKLKMSTEVGELRHHPEYGLANVKGIRNNDIVLIKKILSDSINSMIKSDERFAGIDKLDISYVPVFSNNSATVINVNLIVKLAGTGQLLPISFTINKG